MNQHTHIEDLTDRIRPRTASNVLLWVVAIFFVAFFAWAALTELDRTVRGQGRVIANSHLQTISNLEGGVVEAIMVRVGQVVAAGQELVRLDRTATGAELGSSEASANALMVKIARLQAEVTGREPAYPRVADPAALAQMRIEQALHASRTAELASLVRAGQARIGQATRAVAEAEAMYQAKLTAREARADELRMMRRLVENGLEPRLSLMQAESNWSIAVSEATAASAAVGRARSAVAEAQSTAAQQRQDWRSLAANELAAAQAELGARRPAIPALAERVARTAVRTPLAGRVNRVLVTTVGSAVGPGAPLVEIVPSEETLLIETLVRPQDIAFVRMGQKAKVGITAYDPSIYGSMQGVVVAIAPDAVVNEKTGESFYTVQVRTNTKGLVHNGRALPIATGMVADVSLLGDKRTVLDYILTPITRIKEDALRE